MQQLDHSHRSPSPQAVSATCTGDVTKSLDSRTTDRDFSLSSLLRGPSLLPALCCQPTWSRLLLRRLVHLTALFAILLLLGASLVYQLTAAAPLPAGSALLPKSPRNQPKAPASTASAAGSASGTPTLAPSTNKRSSPYRIPPFPASWSLGGGSIRIPHAFSVLTVVAGPPLTSERIAAAPEDRAVMLLRRAARHLSSSGVIRHPCFHEWLIMHKDTITDAKAAAAVEEEEAVREWWASEQKADSDHTLEQRGQQSEEHELLLSRVRVVGLPHLTSASPHATTRAYALLYGMRLVVTKYVLVHDLDRVLIAAVPSHALLKGSAAPASSRSRTQEWVQHEVTLALQTLSNNAFSNLSHVVIDQARISSDEENVHAYRLQVYATADRQDRVREAQLQAQLVAYVKKLVAPAPTAKLQSKAEHMAVHEVQDGLPVAAYGTSPYFHCQRAPFYSVRVPVPLWMRSSRNANATTTTAMDPEGHANATTAPPVLSTLCELMLSTHFGMPEDYAPEGTVFHRSFCQDWLQFTLLPSPKQSIEANVSESPLAAIGKAAASAGRRRQSAEDGAFTARMDMAQSLGDGVCAVQWAAHLKAAQQWYRERTERKQLLRRRGNQTSTAADEISLSNKTASSPSSEDVKSNLAGASPYLDQYAALLFSNDAAQVSKLAGTYLAFLPNVSHAIHHIRRTVGEKLEHISLKYAAERTRRIKSKKHRTDRELLCLPSHLSRVDLHSTMYPTQWFLTQLDMRCLQHKESCLGSLVDTDERVMQNVNQYLSTTGKWSRGEFRVCMSGGVYLEDPLTQLS
ncbi:hypothetical protein ABL78_6548 [Leptomonas seymouri]|uniref:Uncharacterized protein n=1 Tax=Leptomonas seymouri TaxID=5684 RepID=A0A0N1PAK7_LEPSE|nr:hypothetical protein ABL78_6548 [Leptomonas seymouri]|eukprot:KPI84404.1 hypothetical protein ABL78_6548 [Leptomonas seymouri]